MVLYNPVHMVVRRKSIRRKIERIHIPAIRPLTLEEHIATHRDNTRATCKSDHVTASPPRILHKEAMQVNHISDISDNAPIRSSAVFCSIGEQEHPRSYKREYGASSAASPSSKQARSRRG